MSVTLRQASAESHQSPETAEYDEPGLRCDTKQRLDTSTETLLTATILN